jgi:hypothetical protein
LPNKQQSSQANGKPILPFLGILRIQGIEKQEENACTAPNAVQKSILRMADDTLQMVWQFNVSFVVHVETVLVKDRLGKINTP